MCLFDYSMLILCFTYTFKLLLPFCHLMLLMFHLMKLVCLAFLYDVVQLVCRVSDFPTEIIFILCMKMYSIWLILIFQFSVSVLDSIFNIFFIGLFWGILWYFYVHYFILFTYVPGRPSHITCLCCTQEDGSGPFWHDSCLIFHVACHVTLDYCSLAI